MALVHKFIVAIGLECAGPGEIEAGASPQEALALDHDAGAELGILHELIKRSPIPFLIVLEGDLREYA